MPIMCSGIKGKMLFSPLKLLETLSALSGTTTLPHHSSDHICEQIAAKANRAEMLWQLHGELERNSIHVVEKDVVVAPNQNLSTKKPWKIH
jgi:hypothetical protein